MNTLRYRIEKVMGSLSGTNKVVNITWFVRTIGEGEDPIDVVVLNDQIPVAAQATDAEIIDAVEARRGLVNLNYAPEIPNPEINRGLVGREG